MNPGRAATRISALVTLALTAGGSLTAAASSAAPLAPAPAAAITASSPTKYLVGGLPESVAIGDLNGDGTLDLAVANQANTVSVLLGNGDGTFQTAVNYLTQYGTAGAGPLSVAIADVNGDRAPDLIVATAGGITIFLNKNDTSGTFQIPPLQYLSGTGEGIDKMAVADLNGDGIPDVMFSTCCVVIYIWLGDGHGGFSSQTAFSVGYNGTGSFAVGDLNGDGHPDLAVSYGGFNPGEVAIFLNQGTGTFSKVSDLVPMPALSGQVAIADLNGDGKPDLINAYWNGPGTTPSVSTLLGNGDGTFRPAVTMSTYPGYTNLATGDLNGDGKTDLILATQRAPGSTVGLTGVSLMMGHGDGTLAAPVLLPIGMAPSSVAVAEFNADHNADLAVTDADPYTGALYVQLDAAPTTTLNPNTVDFGPVTHGIPPPARQVTIQNTGGAAQQVTGVALGGANGGNFSIATDACTGHSLQAGASCAVDIGFDPSTVGDFTGSFSVTIDGTPYASTVELAATVVPNVPGAPLNVSAVPGDASASLTWSMPPNTGIGPLTGYQITPYLGSVAQTSASVSGTPPPTNGIIGGLNNGSTYTFVVAATNGDGTGPTSQPSNAITPIQGGNYHPLTPARILDTRSGIGGPTQPIHSGETRAVQITGQGNVPSTGVSAVVLNVTVTGPTAAGYLTVYPAGVSRPTASNLNFVAGETVPNLVEVAVGSGGKVNLFTALASSSGHTDAIFDVAGWVGVATNSVTKDGLYNPLTPARIMDTRSGLGVRPGSVGPAQTVTLNVFGPGGVPAGAGVSGVVLNVTVTSPSAASYLTVFPADAAQRPTASNLNFSAGETIPNRVIVRVGASGLVSFYNAAGTVQVIADIGGWYTDATSTAGGTRFSGVVPTRLLDTREPGFGPLIGGQLNQFQLLDQNNQPVTGVSALVFNVTVTNPTTGSYVTLWPDGPSRPPISDLNFTAGQTVPNLVVVKLGNSATVDIYNALGNTDLVMDLVGFYGTAVPAPAGPTGAFSLRLTPLRHSQ